MNRKTPDRLRAGALIAAAIALVVALTTALVWLLQELLGVDDASPAYLLAVTLVAVWFGTVPASVTAVVSVLVYNFGFTHPLFTFFVADSGQLLNLVLLLVVGIVVGQLAAAQRLRAEAAELREREAQVLVQVSRALATRSDTVAALRTIVAVLRDHARLDRAWVALGDTPARERPVTDAAGADEAAREMSSAYAVLQRSPGAEPPRWMRVRPPSATGRQDAGGDLAFRVPIEAAGRTLGALWSLRDRRLGEPHLEETRMLAAAADQIGQALEQDRLRAEATSAELARRSDAAKSALLDSVSHDLRTPLAAIRAAAGALADPDVVHAPAEAGEIAQSIDDEAARMDRLVGDLLDMSRIEAGALRATPEPYALDDLLDVAIRRLRPVLAGRTLAIEMPDDLPYVLVDATLLDQVISNVLENAARHAPEAPIRVTAQPAGGADQRPIVRLVVEDGGPGVPPEALLRIFDKFYRLPQAEHGSSRGAGMGLAVVRGLVGAMDGSVTARASALGGLAIVIDLPADTPVDG